MGKFAGFIAGLVWICALATGFGLFAKYETTPGPSSVVPAAWPEGSSVVPVPGVPNVVMAVHPGCPCTRGSLAALSNILRRTPPGASVRLLARRAAGLSAGPVALPGVGVVDDPGGVEAARFGMLTSGATAAFDAEGRRRFAGGLNATRGGKDLSEGGLALLAVLRGVDPTSPSADTFGCPLRSPGDNPTSGRRR